MEKYLICMECGNLQRLTRLNDGLKCKTCGGKTIPCFVGIDLGKTDVKKDLQLPRL